MSAFRANKSTENNTSQKVEESHYLHSDSPVMYEDIQVIQQSDYFTPQNFTSTVYNATIAYPAPISSTKSYHATSSETPTQLYSMPMQDGLTQKFNFLGVHLTDPNEYEKKYGKELVDPDKIPFLDDINELNFNLHVNEKLAADTANHKEISYVGDLEALKLIDRNKINLKEYFLA